MSCLGTTGPSAPYQLSTCAPPRQTGTFGRYIGCLRALRQLVQNLGYVNGKLIGTGTSSDSYPTGNTVIGIDGNYTDFPYKGLIDDFKIYNYALTADEVKLDYNQGKSLVLGATGSNSSYAAGAANQEYCIPGDSASCAAPVGQWDFNEGKDNTCSGGTNDVCDKSGNGNDGAWNGSWTNGKIGTAGNFNGSTEVNAGNGSSLNLANVFTIEAWFKTKNDGTIVGKSPQSCSTPQYTMDIQAGNLRLVKPCVNTVGRSSNTVTDGLWHHGAVTHDGSNNVHVYVDGVDRTGTANSVSFADNTDPLFIGSQNGSTYFNGSIDQVRVFNYVRTPAQIAYDYNRGAPVGHWKFEECQGTVAHDASGNGNHGTITIGASGSQASVGTCAANASTAWYNGRTGKYNSSLNFDGTDDYVSVADNALWNFGANNFSISTWVKFNSVTGAKSIMGHDQGGGDVNKWSLLLNYPSDNKITFHFNGAIGPNDVSFAWSPSTSTWYHLSVVRNGSSWYLYVDGIQTGGTQTNSNTIPNPSASLTFGTEGENYAWLNGQLDDVRIYNYALTPTQVKLLYNNNFAAYFAAYFAPSTGAP